MASSSTTPDSSLRLPTYFPVVPKQCKEAAKPFFDCFSEASVYDGTQDPGVARQALKQCADKLPAYTHCAETYLTAKQRATFKAPDSYLAEIPSKQ